MSPDMARTADGVARFNRAVGNRVQGLFIPPPQQNQATGSKAKTKAGNKSEGTKPVRVQQTIDPVGLYRRQNRAMDRSHCARMPAGKGNQVLVGLFHCAKPLAQMRHGPLFEWDHRRHRPREYPRSG